MMHVMYNGAFTATDVASKISTFLRAIYLKYQVTAKLLHQILKELLTWTQPYRQAALGKLLWKCVVYNRICDM